MYDGDPRDQNCSPQNLEQIVQQDGRLQLAISEVEVSSLQP